VSRFVDRGVEFLQTHFPDGQLRELTVHVDEESVHMHFAVAVWNEKISQNRGVQRLLQPSANALLADYEHAQDLVGEAFLDLGIHRGERRAAAARAAMAAGLEGPSPRDHVPPSKWRREQRRKALQDAAKIKTTARDAADGMLADAALVSNSTVKKSRKRAVAEARQRQAEAEQVLVDARIARTGGQIVGAFRHIRNQRLAAESEALNEKMLRRKAQLRQMEERSHALAAANARAEADLIAAQQETEAQAAEAAEITAKAKAAEADALEVVQATFMERHAAKAEIAARQKEMSRAQAEVAHKDAELSAKLSKVDRLLRHLEPLLRRMIGWLKRPDLPGEIAQEGSEILSEAHVLMSDPPSDPNAPQG